MRLMTAAAIVAFGLLAGAAAADSFIDGKAAAERGDYATAVAIWRPMAQARDPRAETYLGLMYDNGYGVPQNREEAFRWFQRAANRGYALAQYNLGFMYQHGRGVQRSQVEALKWYGLAAAQGNVSAQYNLGRMYKHGLAVRRDLVEAYKWLDLASGPQTSVKPLATRDRDSLARRLTAEQIDEAKLRANGVNSSPAP